MGAGAIENFVQNFGASRLLFGTNMPRYTGTAAVALLTYADISYDDKNAIAGDNLKNLLKAV
jgi:predicted TIM-barrel fold metal-dependent hydrolase